MISTKKTKVLSVLATAGLSLTLLSGCGGGDRYFDACVREWANAGGGWTVPTAREQCQSEMLRWGRERFVEEYRRYVQ